MTPTRRAILAGMVEFAKLFPGQRFGQLVANLCWWARQPDLSAVAAAEDDEVSAALEQLLKQHADRLPPPKEPSRTDYHDPQVWQQIFDMVEELSQLYPDWRFGQLVATVAEWAKDERNWGIYDVEDADLLAAAREHLNGDLQRQSAETRP